MASSYSLSASNSASVLGLVVPAPVSTPAPVAGAGVSSAWVAGVVVVTVVWWGIVRWVMWWFLVENSVYVCLSVLCRSGGCGVVEVERRFYMHYFLAVAECCGEAA